MARPLTVIENPADDLDAVIHEELAQVPQRYRVVLVLCYLEGLTQQQAAERLGWPLGTVQSRLARAGATASPTGATRPGPSAPSSMLPLASNAVPAALPASLANSTVSNT